MPQNRKFVKKKNKGGGGEMKFNPEKIRELRRKSGHSLGTMKRLLEARCNYMVSRSTLSCWERGLAEPGLNALAALCKFFEVDPNYFFTN
jgi:transcriptional regulator with XRE-family HTH domain